MFGGNRNVETYRLSKNCSNKYCLLNFDHTDFRAGIWCIWNGAVVAICRIGIDWRIGMGNAYCSVDLYHKKEAHLNFPRIFASKGGSGILCDTRAGNKPLWVFPPLTCTIFSL